MAAMMEAITMPAMAPPLSPPSEDDWSSGDTTIPDSPKMAKRDLMWSVDRYSSNSMYWATLPSKLGICILLVDEHNLISPVLSNSTRLWSWLSSIALPLSEADIVVEFPSFVPGLDWKHTKFQVPSALMVADVGADMRPLPLLLVISIWIEY